MEYYRFYDVDLNGDEEDDIKGIKGEEYKELIRVCCEHSKYVSFIIYDKSVSGYDELCKHKFKSVDFTPKDKYLRKYEILYCNICADLQKFLENNVNDVFGWMLGREFTNPEDPTFFREDGTIFFSSCIHEGIVTLRPKDEDVSHIVSNNSLWIHSDNDVGASYIIYKTIDLSTDIDTDEEALKLSEFTMKDLKISNKIKEYKFAGLVRYKSEGYDAEFHCKMDSKYRVNENVIVNIRILKNKCEVLLVSAM